MKSSTSRWLFKHVELILQPSKTSDLSRYLTRHNVASLYSHTSDVIHKDPDSFKWNNQEVDSCRNTETLSEEKQVGLTSSKFLKLFYNQHCTSTLQSL